MSLGLSCNAATAMHTLVAPHIILLCLQSFTTAEKEVSWPVRLDANCNTTISQRLSIHAVCASVLLHKYLRMCAQLCPETCGCYYVNDSQIKFAGSFSLRLCCLCCASVFYHAFTAGSDHGNLNMDFSQRLCRLCSTSSSSTHI